ncbi:MAG TPA: Pvc16 family protein [Ktedonobacteraceae bacterium]|nr:Pvc16 family protein [Ktedonobacteraceae bacterium]
MSSLSVISDLDKTLEQLFQLEFGNPLPVDLSFSLPDKNFKPLSQSKSTLNCYLYEINEDRELRSNEPILRRNADGTIDRLPPPVRVKLSYCITAWSPAQATPGGGPEMDEHTWLSLALQVLLKYPLLPASILQGSLGKQEPLPYTTTILPDSSKATSDFWSAIGGQLRPSLEYKVTIALPYQQPATDPMVTTLGLGLTGDQPFYTIGGTVWDTKASPGPIASAWVRLDQTGQVAVSDELGRFLFEHIAAGNYSLTVRAVGFQEGKRTISVPAQSRLFDVSLKPL